MSTQIEFTQEEIQKASTIEGRMELLNESGINEFFDLLFKNCIVVDGSMTIDDIKQDIKMKMCTAEGEQLKSLQLLVETMNQLFRIAEMRNIVDNAK